MFISLLIILFVFIVLFVAVWLWYYNNEINNAKNTKGSYEEGLKAFKKNDYEKAIKLFLYAVEHKINLVNSLFTLGLCYLKLNDDEKAKEAFVKVLKENKDYPDCNFQLGVIMFRSKFYNEALEYFEKALELSPNNAEIVFYIAKCKDELCSYDTMEEGQSVINEYLKIAGQENLPASYEINLARAYAKTGQIDKALEGCKKALLKNDKDVECYKLLGLLQLIQKDSEEAKNTLTTAISLNTDDLEAHNILSYVLCQNDDRSLIQKCRIKYHQTVKKIIVSD